MLDQKQTRAIFLFEFKMDRKAAETTHNINKAFGPGTANKCTGRGGSRGFTKKMRALKMRNTVAGHWKLTMISWDKYWNRSFYNYMRSCWRAQHWPWYSRLAFEGNRKGEKAPVSRGLVSWPPIIYIIIFKCCLLLFYNTSMNHFSTGLLMCTKKWILNDNCWWPVQWLDWEKSPKHFPKPNLHHKKVIVTV